MGVRYIIKGATQVLHNCAIGPAPFTAFLFFSLQTKTPLDPLTFPKQCTPLHSAVSRVAASQPQLHTHPRTQPQQRPRVRQRRSRLPARSRFPTSRHNGRCSVLQSRLLCISNSRRSSRKIGRHSRSLRRKPVRAFYSRI